MSSNVATILSALEATRAEVLSLKAEVLALRSALSVKPSVPAVAEAPVAEAKKARKIRAKNPDAPPREASAWVLFTNRVTGVLRENGYTGKELSTIARQFCSDLKKENPDFSSWTDADILARRAGWTRPTESKQQVKSASASVVSDGESVDSAPAPAPAPAPVAVASDGEQDGGASVSSGKKARKPWSAETKAAAAAKRAAKKAAKAGDSAPDTTVSATTVTTPPLPASPAESDDESAVPADFQRLSLVGVKYWVNLKTGHCYNRNADDSRGEWAGLFKRDPKPRVDSSVPEPDELA